MWNAIKDLRFFLDFGDFYIPVKFALHDQVLPVHSLVFLKTESTLVYLSISAGNDVPGKS
jgi:hypothetical protein